MANVVFLLRRHLRYVCGACLFISLNAVAALQINLPVGSCPKGSIMTTTGGVATCGVIPPISTEIEAITVSAPRLDANGNPVATAPTEIKANIGAASSGSCVNIPAGYTTTGTGANCALVPPATAPTTSYKRFGITDTPAWHVAPSYTALASQVCSNMYLPTVKTVASIAAGGGGACLETSATCTVACTGGGAGTMGTITSCPSGYTNTAGTCNLTNAAIVQKPVDGVCTIIRTNNSYTADANDADCSATGAPAVNSDKVTAQKPDGSTATVQAMPDGTTKVTTTTPDNTGQVTDALDIYVGADNKVKGSATSQAPGVGTGSGALTPSGSGATSSDVAAVKSSVDAAKSQAATDAAAAKGKLDEIADDLKPSTNVGAPALPTSLYTPTGKTMGGVLTTFKDNMQQKPFYAAATGFFNVSINSGACPIWETQAWVFHIRFDQQCSQTMQQIWPFIYAIVVACAGFLAFRWAFL